jgi:hypothetical protein
MSFSYADVTNTICGNNKLFNGGSNLQTVSNAVALNTFSENAVVWATSALTAGGGSYFYSKWY